MTPNISNTPHIVERLKACPFPHEVKRGPFVETDTVDFGYVRVACADCGCAGPFVPIHGSEEVTAAEQAEAIAAWNTRTPDPVITAYEAALKRIVETPNDGWVIAGAALAAQGRTP